jgi:hypothetical protein
MFSISKFKSNINVIRPNLFFAEVILPPAIAEQVRTLPGSERTRLTDVNNTFKFRCQATDFPGRTLATTDDIHNGPSVKHPYDLTYSDINLTIVASEDMIEKFVFDKWMETMVTTSGVSNGQATGGFVRYYDNVIKNGRIIINQINEKNERIAKCTLYGAFPIGMGPLNLSWDEFDSYQRFAVTISYRYHENDYVKVKLTDF